MKKIVFIVPYYGKWPDFFRLWAYTAGFLSSQNIDFLLFTDLEVDFKLPDNIKIIKMSFNDLKNHFENKLGFNVSMETPYKLCDFRPSYGFVFQDYIQEYDFWGHCDMDVLWGNVRKFITNEILESYDKIQYLGHFVLYKNIEKMNTLFIKKAGLFNYKNVFTTPLFCSFDEHPGVMRIVHKNKISNYIEINFADISPIYKDLYISKCKNYESQVLYWENGSVYRKFFDGKKIQKQEFMYMHFQKKKPLDMVTWEKIEPKSRIVYSNKCFIVDDGKLDCNSSFCANFCVKWSKEERTLYKKEKIFSFLKMNLVSKINWLKIILLTRITNKEIKDGRYNL